MVCLSIKCNKLVSLRGDELHQFAKSLAKCVVGHIHNQNLDTCCIYQSPRILHRRCNK